MVKLYLHCEIVSQYVHRLVAFEFLNHNLTWTDFSSGEGVYGVSTSFGESGSGRCHLGPLRVRNRVVCEGYRVSRPRHVTRDPKESPESREGGQRPEHSRRRQSKKSRIQDPEDQDYEEVQGED